jgi:hypothetical protein
VSWRPPPRIRAIAIGLITRGDELLVHRGHDVLWKHLDELGEEPLYPDGLLTLLRR